MDVIDDVKGALTHSFWPPRERGRDSSMCVVREAINYRFVLLHFFRVQICHFISSFNYDFVFMDAVRFDWALWALSTIDFPIPMFVFVAGSLGILLHRKVCPIPGNMRGAYGIGLTNEYSNMRAENNDKNIAQTQFTIIFICTKMLNTKPI